MQSTETDNDESNVGWFSRKFPAVSDAFEYVYDRVLEAVEVVNNITPWWFDFMIFLVLMIAYEFLLTGNYNLMSLGLVSFVCLNITEALERKPGIPDKQKEEALGLDPDSNPARVTKKKNYFEEANFLSKFFIALGIAFCTLVFNPTTVRFFIFLIGCRPGIVWLKKGKNFLFDPGWRYNTRRLSAELIAKKNASEPQLVQFLNQVLRKLWRYGQFPLGVFLQTTFSHTLISKLALASASLPRLPKTGVDSFRVTSVNFKDKDSRKLVIDVNITFNGYCSGVVSWPSAEAYSFQSYQLDARFRLEIRTVARYLPKGSSALFGQEFMSALKEEPDKITIRLKKINTFNTCEVQRGTTDVIKRRFLRGAEEVLLSFFPVDVSLDAVPEDKYTTEAMNSYIAASAVTRTTSSQPLTSANPTSAPPTAATPTPVTPVKPRNDITPVTAAPGTPNSTIGTSKITDNSQVIRNRPLSTASGQGNTGAIATPGTQASVPISHYGSQSSLPISPYGTQSSVPVSPAGMQSSGPNTGTQDLNQRTRDSFISSSDSVSPLERVDKTTSVKREGSTVFRELKSKISTVSGASAGVPDKGSVFGSVELTTQFVAPCSLFVTIHKIWNLPLSKGRTPHPYAKLVLQTPNKDDLKESTAVHGKTTDPVFENKFKFQLDRTLSEYTLKVTAKTKHKFHHALGQVVLGFVVCPTKVVVEPRWYDLAMPEKNTEIHRVEY